MAKAKKRHHVVPAHYLAGFSDEKGQLVQTRLQDGVPRTVSRLDSAVRSNFYTVELDGESSDSFEDTLGQAESAAAEPLRQLVVGGSPFTLDEREAAATWCAVQYLRGPDMRQMTSDLLDMLFKSDVLARGPDGMREVLEQQLGHPPAEEELAETWASLEAVDDYRLEARPEHHLQMMSANLLPCVRSFMARPWTVVRFTRRRLGTSDAPVVMVPRVRQSAAPAAGYMNAGLVLLPLARNALLIMGDIQGTEAARRPIPVRQGTTHVERTVNGLVAGTARSVVFHHPEDEPFKDAELGVPRDREVEGADRLYDTITKMRGTP